MKYVKKVIILSLFIIAFILGTSYAFAGDINPDMNLTADDNEMDNIEMNIDSDDENTLSIENCEDELTVNNDTVEIIEEYEADPKGIYVSPNGSAKGNGAYSDPCNTIQRAITLSKAGGTIYVAGGTYKINTEISISKGDLTFTSYDGTSPVIDGQNNCSLLKMIGNQAFTFKGITFMNGHAENGGVFDFKNFNKYTATFYNCTFINNSATNCGGVFYEGRNEVTYQMWDFLYLTSCTFINNTAKTGSIYYGGLNTFSYLTMNYCVCIGNSNYAVFATSNRGGSVSENYWAGNSDITKTINYNNGETDSSRLIFISDNEKPTLDDNIIMTAKIVSSTGADYSSNIYIPELPAIFSATSGTLTVTGTTITNKKGQSVLKPSQTGNVTISVSIYGDTVTKTLNILPCPQYVSADAAEGAGNGSYNKPYCLKDAITAVNNGGVNKIDLFEGDYEFNETYIITRNVTICPYSTPYMTSKVTIKTNNGFLIISPDIHVDMMNLTIINSNSETSPIFTLQSNSSLNITNFIIKNNTLNNGAAVIANVGNNASLNIECSHIINNNAKTQTAAQFGYLFENHGTISANYNWWGSNNGSSFYELLSLGNEINATKYYILTQSQEKTILRTEWSSKFTITLKDNEGNAIDKYIPPIGLIFSTNTGELDITEYDLTGMNSYTVVNIISQTTDEATVETSSDNETLKTIFEYEIPLTEIFISVDGDDENGNGSFEKPFFTIYKAIIRAKESGAAIYFLNGTYDVKTVCEGYVYTTGTGGVNEINNRNINLSSYNGNVVFDRSNSYYMFQFGSNTNVRIMGIDFKNSKFDTGSKFGSIRSYGNLTIENCSFDNVTQGGNFAEWISNMGGKLYVYNSNFTNIFVSSTYNTNGAVHTSGTGSYSYFNNCYFENNGWVYNSPGTIGNSESAFRVQYGVVDVVNCVFKNSSNIAMVYDHGKMSFKNCTFENNAGKACLHISSHAYGYNVTDCTFINNKGGAIDVSTAYLDDNEVNIYNSRFINNSAKTGGAITLAKSGAVISNCYFEGNSAVNGGAIYNSYASLLVEHCEFYNNTATEKGGSIYTEGNDDYIDIQYNIFSNSKADIGGVIYSKGITSLFYNIMTNGSANTGSYIYNDNRIGNVYIKIMDMQNITAYAGIPILLNATLTDDMANPITGGKVVFIINNDQVEAASNEGTATISYIFEKDGTYTIGGNYTGSRRYIVIVGTATANVVKTTPNLVGCNVNAKPNDEANYTLKLTDIFNSPLSNKDIYVSYNGNTTKYTTDENGTVNVKLDSTIKGGIYDITANFTHVSFNPVVIVNQYVLKEKSIINADDMVMNYKDGSCFNITLIGENGPATNKAIEVSIGNKTSTLTTDMNGIISVEITEIPGNYDVTLTFNGDDYYLNATQKAKITTSKGLPGMAFEIEGVMIEENDLKVIAHINPNIKGNVTFIVNEREEQAEISSSKVWILLGNVSSGKYNVTVIYGGDDLFKNETIITSFDVGKNKTTSLTINDLSVYYSGECKITATLKDFKGNPISGKNITVIINNEKFSVKSDENGIASKEIALNIGTYAFNVQFSGDEDYYASYASGVLKVSSTIQASDMTRGYNSGVDFKASLLDKNGKALANTKVSIKVNGKEYIITSDNNGIVKLNKKLAAGTYTITVTNPNTKEIATKKAVIVKRIIQNKNLNMFYNSESKFKVKLIGNDGKAVGAGQKAVIKINNKKFTVKTDKNGYATLKITEIPKKYTITVEYKGYKTTNKLTVKHVIKTSNVKVKKSAKTLKIKVTLKASKALKSKKITVKFKGKKYTAKTNKKGIATIKIKKNVIKKLKAGKKYAFQVIYLKSIVKKQVIVKK